MQTLHQTNTSHVTLPPPSFSLRTHHLLPSNCNSFSDSFLPLSTLLTSRNIQFPSEMAHQEHHHPPPPQKTQLSYQIVKTTTAATIGGSCMFLSGLTLAGTVVALVVATPLLVIFSPVLVPAAVTVFLVAAGLVASGGFGVSSVSVFYWLYKYVRGQHPVGAGKLDRARDKLTGKAMEVKERSAEQIGTRGTQG